MPAASNKLCKAQTTSPDGAGTSIVYFRSNVNMYTADFATATGIAAAPANEQMYPATPIRSLIRSGQLVRMIAVTKGTAIEPSRQIRILVANANTDTIGTWADGAKTIPGISAAAIIAIRHANRMRLS